jgi:hypothetical protein
MALSCEAINRHKRRDRIGSCLNFDPGLPSPEQAGLTPVGAGRLKEFNSIFIALEPTSLLRPHHACPCLEPITNRQSTFEDTISAASSWSRNRFGLATAAPHLHTGLRVRLYFVPRVLCCLC